MSVGNEPLADDALVLVEVVLTAKDVKQLLALFPMPDSSVCTATGALKVRSIERTAELPLPVTTAMFDDEDEEDEDAGWVRCFGSGIFMAARSSDLSSRNENGAQRLLRDRTGLPPVSSAADDNVCTTVRAEQVDEER